MPDSSKSLHDRLKEGVVDFCERMADVEAGRRNQYVGISQQMHDAEDERRRLRKKAQEENEQARQKNLNDDAGGDEHHGEKDTYELGERWKPDKTTNDREAQKEKTAEDNLRKDKAVDKGAAHSIGKLQKQQISESSSDEELQWATDRMMLGDLDEVPVEIGQSKKEMPNSSNATKDPPLRLRGGGGAKGWHKLEDLMNNDYTKRYPNALREETRGFGEDYSPYKKKHVHFDESAQEPHRNLSFGGNPRAGHSTSYGLGTGARAPTFTGQSSRGERHQHGGRNGLGFGPSSSEHRGKQGTGFGFSEHMNFSEWSSSKDNGGKRGTSVKFSIVHSSDEEESEFESLSHDKGKEKSRRSSSKHYGGKQGAEVEFSNLDLSDEEESDSRRSAHNKGKDKSRQSSSKHNRGKRGTGSVFSNEDLSDEEEPDSDSIRSSHKKGKDKSRGRRRSRSPSDDENSDDYDRDGNRSSKSAKAAKGPPPPPPPPVDHYGVLGLTRHCSAQEVTEASKRMRIRTHPDKLKKEHMSAEEKAKIDETAANVGYAAEVLSDPELRKEYDRLVRRWQWQRQREYSPP